MGIGYGYWVKMDAAGLIGGLSAPIGKGISTGRILQGRWGKLTTHFVGKIL